MGKYLEKKDYDTSGIRPERNFINFVKYETKNTTIPFVMLILGVLFILLKGDVLSVLVTILGVLLMIAGVVLGFSLMSRFSPLTVFIASTLFIFGLISVINPRWVAGFFLKVVGLCVLLNSLIRILSDRTMKNKADSYKFFMVVDLVSAVVGLLLFLIPEAWMHGARVLFIVFGILLMILGVFNLYSAFKFYKEGRYVDDGSGVVWEE